MCGGLGRFPRGGRFTELGGTEWLHSARRHPDTREVREGCCPRMNTDPSIGQRMRATARSWAIPTTPPFPRSIVPTRLTAVTDLTAAMGPTAAMVLTAATDRTAATGPGSDPSHDHGALAVAVRTDFFETLTVLPDRVRQMGKDVSRRHPVCSQVVSRPVPRKPVQEHTCSNRGGK